MSRDIIPLASAAAVRHMLRRSPASVLLVAPLPLEQFFYAPLRPFIDGLPDDVDVGVAAVADLTTLGYVLSVNELAVFRGASLQGRYTVPRDVIVAAFLDEKIRGAMWAAWGTSVTNAAVDALRGAPSVAGIASTPRAPHAVLEVDEDATPKEIQKAHRRMTRLYHPDRLQALVEAGQLGADVLEFAKNRLAEVNAAAAAMHERHRAR
jgi:hypothetical protein